MKVLTFSRHFPKGHPKATQPTFFVEKIFAGLTPSITPDPLIIPGFIWAQFDDCKLPKHHTIRAGSRFKPGDMASLRVWSDKPYRSKQVEFAQVEVKKVWEIEIGAFWWIDNRILEHDQVMNLAKNDGLAYDDFVNWFNIHPKKKEQVFTGQIICWSDKVNYQ
jgi:hypothetical protein